MATLTREVRINAPKAQVWEALSDFGGISVFNPTVPKSYSTNGQNQGVGATRHCDLNGGPSIEERVLEWRDGEKMVIDIYEGKGTPPFKTAIATISVREAGPNTTIASGTLDYKLKMGPIGALMDALMVKSAFGKSWTGLFAGLKHYVETGERVEGPKALNYEPVKVLA